MGSPVRPVKALGQHFLNDESIAQSIAESIPEGISFNEVIEIGPGMGILTQFLLLRFKEKLHVVELDGRSVSYLQTHFPGLGSRIHQADFLRFDLNTIGPGPYAIIGNYPYNISSQILFRVLDHYEQVPVLAGMFQKEVAVRVASGPGNRDYGILSVLLQAHYRLEYLFTVPPHHFNPPPKVQSGVIRMIRKEDATLPCDAGRFRRVVKMAFNQRRKVLRNSLSALAAGQTQFPYAAMRPEQLDWTQFVELVDYFSGTGAFV